MAKSGEAWIRRSARVIRMVGELHRMGFQRLRIMPFEYPLAYRVYIAPAVSFSGPNGAVMDDLERPYAGYSSASDDAYFEWTDARGNTARQLADKFVERFPELCDAGRGRDWEYAGWLADLESVLEAFPSRLPIVEAEDLTTPPERLRNIPLRLYGERTANDDGSDRSFPLPPPI